MSTRAERKRFLWNHLGAIIDASDFDQLGIPEGTTEVEDSRWAESVREVRNECYRKGSTKPAKRSGEATS
jgi:hypothetical protein